MALNITREELLAMELSKSVIETIDPGTTFKAISTPEGRAKLINNTTELYREYLAVFNKQKAEDDAKNLALAKQAVAKAASPKN